MRLVILIYYLSNPWGLDSTHDLKGESGWNFELNCELGQIFFLHVIRQENYSTLKY